MSKIMVIAGGEWQCPLVKNIKEMGHEIICSNLYEDSPAFKYADYCEVADVLDKEKNLEIALKYLPDAVLTDQSDIAVTTVAYVADKLGIKGIGLNIAEQFTNKRKMREFCKNNNFPTPAYKECDSKCTAQEFFRKVGKKMIMKPLDSQSSRGVHIINCEGDIEKYFDETVSFSNSTNSVLLEEYIKGTEFTVDGIMTPDGYYTTAISRKKHFDYNPSIAQELLFTYCDDVYDYEKLERINEDIATGMGLPFGLTHAEYKCENGEFYLIEIAARGGGTKISSNIVPIMSGLNTNKVLVDELLGNRQKIELRKKDTRCAMLGFFDFKAGIVESVEGIDDAKKLVGVDDLYLDIHPGQEIGEAQDDRSRVGHYILWADDIKKLRELQREVLKIVKVVYREVR